MILAVKMKQISVFEVWLSVLTGALFLCGWPRTIQRVFSNNKGFTSKCVWSLKLCPKWEMIFLFATSASRCETTSNLFLSFNDFTAHYMHRHVLPHNAATKLHFQKLSTWPLTFFVASCFFFCFCCSPQSFFVLFCDEHKLMTSAAP